MQIIFCKNSSAHDTINNFNSNKGAPQRSIRKGCNLLAAGRRESGRTTIASGQETLSYVNKHNWFCARRDQGEFPLLSPSPLRMGDALRFVLCKSRSDQENVRAQHYHGTIHDYHYQVGRLWMLRRIHNL